MKLRDYQEKAIDDIYGSFRRGNKNVMLQLPTGGGKTLVTAQICKDGYQNGRRVLVLAHREELVKQAAAKIEQAIGSPVVGIIKSGVVPDYDLPIQVASVQTIINKLDKVGDFNLVICDECFPAGTPIDGKPIESLKVGDLVNSFNETTGKIELKPIIRIFCNPSDKAVFVSVGGEKIECTPEHPFYTKRGWIPASKLTTEDYLYVNKLPNLSELVQATNNTDSYDSTRESCLLFDGVSQGVSEDNQTRTTPTHLCGMPKRIRSFNKESKTNENPLLLEVLQRLGEESIVVRNYDKDESNIRFGSDEIKQSNEGCQCEAEDVRDIESDRSQTCDPWGEWYGSNNTSTTSVQSSNNFELGLGSGIYSSNPHQAGNWLSHSLQDRYSESFNHVGNRSGWEQSSFIGSQGAGCQENRVFEWQRVGSIEIQKQGSLGGSAIRNVYNIEVLDNHNYFVANVLVHNCHHSTANTYRAIYDRYHTAKLLGVTATPIRLNGKGFKDLFDDLVTSLTTQQLIELGHLSKFKLYASQKQMNFEGVGKKLGEYSQAEIADINDPTELAGDVVASYERYAKGSQCLVFATSVEHSQAIAKAYNQNDIKAIHLDGTTPSSERSQALVDFIDKKVQVISNCSLFGEGLDIPALETVQIARRTASVGLHLQMLGRVLRVAEGKEHAIVIDHTDNWKRLGLPTKPRNWSLKGVKDDKPQELEIDEETEEVIVKENDEKLSMIPIVNDNIILNEILTPNTEVEMWEYEFNQLVHTLEQRGYKPSWLGFRLAELRPPLVIWRLCAKYCGHHWKWADHKFEDQQNKSQQVLELV